jgi:circadian clock protein KaiC
LAALVSRAESPEPEEEAKVTSKPPELERLSTGSAAFDRILGGGLPVRSLTVIAGEPGAGKTLFALQALFHLARQGKKCLYFTTLSEPSLKLVYHMQQLAFFDEEAIGKQLIFVDLGSVIRGQDADAVLEAITSRVEREEPAIVVIDSFKAMRDLLGDAPAVRTFTYDLAVHIAGWGAATLFVGEYTEDEMAHYAEFAIADGILRFSTSREELTAVRVVEVLKLRGADCVTGRHFFEIGAGGLTFFPRVRSPDAKDDGSIASFAERASTGIAGFDEMLGGGLPRESSTVVQGATGTGKTLLGLQFLLEGARRGEPGIHFTLEETADQLRGIAHGFGWDLRELERRRLFTICYVSPVELSTDSFLARARQRVEEVGAKRAVLDSLTSMALGVSSERRFKELVYAVAKHFRALGVTFSLNMEIAELLGSAQLSGHGISFAADNVIQLKYVELGGKLERAISVLKARGVRHETGVRRMNFTESGIEVGSPFKGLRGVLTGLPTPVEVQETGRE